MRRGNIGWATITGVGLVESSRPIERAAASDPHGRIAPNGLPVNVRTQLLAANLPIREALDGWAVLSRNSTARQLPLPNCTFCNVELLGERLERSNDRCGFLECFFRSHLILGN